MLSRALLAALAIAVFDCLPVAPCADMAIVWYSIDGGGDMSTAGYSFQLSGTMGQPDTDEHLTMTGTTLSLTGGFWAGVPATAPVPGDCTGDGVVDFEDFEIFATCLTGPDVNVPDGCHCADLDGDDDSDLADFAAFQHAFGGQ